MIAWFEKHRGVSWIITILIAILIFYISSITFSIGPTKQAFPFKSVAYHFFAFFVLGFFLLICLVKGYANKKLICLGLVIAILYGISDEIHQIFVPSRFFDIGDILTNSAGILFSGVLYSLRCKNCHFKISKSLQSK